MATQARACGLDFGTSNSCIVANTETTPLPIQIQNGKSVIPTAVFYGFDAPIPSYGSSAMENYLMGEEGRLMRSLKSTLGTSLFDEKTSIKTNRMKVSDIIGSFLLFMKKALESETNQTCDSVTIGRPVNFHNHDKDRNEKAENQLRAAASEIGFKHIEFQFEPIAAALDYESTVEQEQLAIIVDIGGGTSDFSIVKVSPEGRKKGDRTEDVLANEGIRLGGTDIDKLISLQYIMPDFGRGSLLGDKNLPFPSWYFSDLSTWHKINGLYDRKIISEVSQLQKESHSPDLIENLLTILRERQGHEILSRVEHLKIDLSEYELASFLLKLEQKELDFKVNQKQFEETIADFANSITNCIKSCVNQAGVSQKQIESVFLTGGGTRIPYIQQAISNALPDSSIINRDSFSSVAKGLALDAQRKFG